MSMEVMAAEFLDIYQQFLNPDVELGANTVDAKEGVLVENGDLLSSCKINSGMGTDRNSNKNIIYKTPTVPVIDRLNGSQPNLQTSGYQHVTASLSNTSWSVANSSSTSSLSVVTTSQSSTAPLDSNFANIDDILEILDELENNADTSS